MEKQEGKFLINFIHGLTQRQLFFGFWALIVGLFVFLMYEHYRKTTRRNFRPPQDGPGAHVRVDARQLKEPGKTPVKKL